MKIAVTYSKGEVFQHFGHTEEFKVYEIEDEKIVSSEIFGSNGEGHGALAGLLGQNQIDVLICGGIGEGAKQALSQWGIELYPGVSGSADKAVQAFLNHTLEYNPNTSCSHHSGEHSCGEHSCGGNH